MKWNSKEVKDLSNDELQSANAQLAKMQAYREDQIAKKKERHENIEMTINPTFIELQNEVKKELETRNLWR